MNEPNSVAGVPRPQQPQQPPQQQVSPKQMVDGKLAINTELCSVIREDKKKISSLTTPKPHVKTRPDGLDYVEEKYMRDQLNEHYPVWSWDIVETQFLGSEWCIVTGVLNIVDNSIPRKYASMGAARIQFKKGLDHTPENVVDVDKNVASANTNAFKRAINRLCNICDDVYRKQVEDYALSEGQLKELETAMEGLDKSTTSTIWSRVDDQSVSTLNFDATLRRIEQLKDKEKK